jgi:hypothetical protein
MGFKKDFCNVLNTTKEYSNKRMLQLSQLITKCLEDKANKFDIGERKKYITESRTEFNALVGKKLVAIKRNETGGPPSATTTFVFNNYNVAVNTNGWAYNDGTWKLTGKTYNDWLYVDDIYSFKPDFNPIIVANTGGAAEFASDNTFTVITEDVGNELRQLDLKDAYNELNNSKANIKHSHEIGDLDNELLDIKADKFEAPYRVIYFGDPTDDYPSVLIGKDIYKFEVQDYSQVHETSTLGGFLFNNDYLIVVKSDGTVEIRDTGYDYWSEPLKVYNSPVTYGDILEDYPDFESTVIDLVGYHWLTSNEVFFNVYTGDKRNLKDVYEELRDSKADKFSTDEFIMIDDWVKPNDLFGTRLNSFEYIGSSYWEFENGWSFYFEYNPSTTSYSLIIHKNYVWYDQMWFGQYAGVDVFNFINAQWLYPDFNGILKYGYVMEIDPNYKIHYNKHYNLDVVYNTLNNNKSDRNHTHVDKAKTLHFHREKADKFYKETSEYYITNQSQDEDIVGKDLISLEVSDQYMWGGLISLKTIEDNWCRIEIHDNYSQVAANVGGVVTQKNFTKITYDDLIEIGIKPKIEGYIIQGANTSEFTIVVGEEQYNLEDVYNNPKIIIAEDETEAQSISSENPGIPIYYPQEE